MKNKKIEIAKRMKKARELSGLSQAQVARKLDMHRPSISEIEAGRRNISANEINKFSQIYSVDANWLLTGEGSTELSEEVQIAARALVNMKKEDIEKLIETLNIIKNKGMS